MQSDSTPKTEFLNIAPEWTFLVSHESGFKYDSISRKTTLIHAEMTEIRMTQVTPQNHTRAKSARVQGWLNNPQSIRTIFHFKWALNCIDEFPEARNIGKAYQASWGTRLQSTAFIWMTATPVLTRCQVRGYGVYCPFLCSLTYHRTCGISVG